MGWATGVRAAEPGSRSGGDRGVQQLVVAWNDICPAPSQIRVAAREEEKLGGWSWDFRGPGQWADGHLLSVGRYLGEPASCWPSFPAMSVHIHGEIQLQMEVWRMEGERLHLFILLPGAFSPSVAGGSHDLVQRPPLCTPQFSHY